MYEASELLVYDQAERCPYLPGREARMPLRQPLHTLSGGELDARLAAGDRRCGTFLYRTACATCQACVPLRIPIDTFESSRSQQRVWRKGQDNVDVYLGPPVVDETRTELYNKHRQTRGLEGRDGPISIHEYYDFLVNSCCETLEIDYVINDVLAAVAILDRGEQALSAVYCYFDPDYARHSLGVFSILTQVDLGRRWNMKYLYLGLYIAESAPMRYKTQYRPHELLMNGRWTAADPRNSSTAPFRV